MGEGEGEETWVVARIHPPSQPFPLENNQGLVGAWI